MVFPMKMKIDTPARLATVTLDEESQVDLAGLDVFIQTAMTDPVGLMNLELVVPAGDHHSEELRKRGFTISGSVTSDAITKIVMKKTLSSPAFADMLRSRYNPDYNPDLATPAPVLQRTPAEVSALTNLDASMTQHYSDSSVARRLQAIEAEVKPIKSRRDEHTTIAKDAERMANAIARTPESKE
jgi:hypothetical protein